MMSRMAALTSSRPPMSSQRTAGTEGVPMADAVRFSDYLTAAPTSALVTDHALAGSLDDDEAAAVVAAAAAAAAACAASALTSRESAPDQ